MDLKNCFTNAFILFLLFAVPVLCTGRLKQLNSEIYEIDYRGPETHSYMPPPNRSGGVNTNGGLQQNQKEHGRSKRPLTENTTKMVKKLHG
ncbi:hypothetical protein Ccrd_007493 [Cynara cardunculus var. scolymus]|uniref:Transmembrane protein n=1 Tax=Cynara cardunculus var. scolymus TaxID=59895 RepID=A0A103XH08_CYNCS|nr:hypothetical protein Ccrd_007493 [Cynara cardunculus var. scolymus]